MSAALAERVLKVELAEVVHKVGKIRSLYYQRECIPGTEELVRRLAPHDDRIKPRWQIDDCGWQNRTRGVHHLAPAGAYKDIRVWGGRDDWLNRVVPAVLDLHSQELKDSGLSRKTFMLWAECESLSAHKRTGRRCIVRPVEVGKMAKRGKSTMQKCRSLAGKLGLRVIVFHGRKLNLEECLAARKAGSGQSGLSDEAALTVPEAVDNCPRRERTETPTRGKAPLVHSLPSRGPTYHAASGESKETASPPRPKRRRTCRSQPAVIAARDLIGRMTWLKGSKLHEIIPTVHKCATDPLMPWTAYDVELHINSVNQRLGYTSMTEHHVGTNPAGLLAWYLRGVDPQADHPRLRAFLTGTAAEQRAPWCGRCDQVTRHVEVDGLPGRCPRCHPLAGEQPW